MVCLSRPYPFKFFKGSIPQTLLGSFLSNLSHLLLFVWVRLLDWWNSISLIFVHHQVKLRKISVYIRQYLRFAWVMTIYKNCHESFSSVQLQESGGRKVYIWRLARTSGGVHWVWLWSSVFLFVYLQRKMSELSHQFFLTLHVKLGSHKLEKTPKPHFGKKGPFK